MSDQGRQRHEGDCSFHLTGACDCKWGPVTGRMSDKLICGSLISVRPTDDNGFNDVTPCRLGPGHAGDHLPDMSRYHREVVPAKYSWVANKR